MAQAKQNQVKDTRTRVLLVDDHAVVRYGIAQLINQQSDLVVCGEEEDASQRAQRHRQAQARPRHRRYFSEGQQRAGVDAEH